MILSHKDPQHPHGDTCDDCGHAIWLERPRLPREPIICERCWEQLEPTDPSDC